MTSNTNETPEWPWLYFLKEIDIYQPNEVNAIRPEIAEKYIKSEYARKATKKEIAAVRKRIFIPGDTPKINERTQLKIKDPCLFVEHDIDEKEVVNIQYGDYYALCEIRDTRRKILVRSQRPHTKQSLEIPIKRIPVNELEGLDLSNRVKEAMGWCTGKGKEEGYWKIEQILNIHERGDVGYFYVEAPQINEAYRRKLLDMSCDKLDELVDDFITDGYDYDPRIMKWGESGLIRISDNPQDHRLERFRGHSLIVKNSSSGCSTIGERIGINYGKSTAASLYGYSTGKEDYPPLIHNEFGSFVFDEFLNQDPIAHGVLNYMQTGRAKSASAAKEIEAKGLAKLSWVGNLPRDTATPEDMIISLERAMEKIAPEGVVGLGARIGFILWDNSVQGAETNKEKKISFEKSEELKAVVEDIIKCATPLICGIYNTEIIQEWLEEPDNEYKEKTKELSERILQLGNNRLKTFIENNGNAYRHVKGIALEVALKRHLGDFLHDKYNVEDILKTAKEEYEEIKSINLDSFIRCIGWFSTLNVGDLIMQRFRALSYKSSQGLILSIIQGIQMGEVMNDRLITLPELERFFNQVEREKRINILGNTSKWTYLLQKIPKKKSKKKFESQLYTLFQIETLEYDGDLALRVRDKDLLSKISVERIEKEIMGTTDTTGTTGTTDTTGTDTIPNVPNVPKKRGGYDKIKTIENIISELCNADAEGLADVVDITLQAQVKGIGRDTTTQILKDLKTKGIVYEPRQGRYRLTEK